MHIKIYIRKLCYSWRYMEENILAWIGLSPPVVKFGLVRPGMADFVKTVPIFDRKNLKNGDSFLNYVQLYHSRILIDSLKKIEADHKTKLFVDSIWQVLILPSIQYEKRFDGRLNLLNLVNLVNLVDQASGFRTTAVWALGQLYNFVLNLRYWRTQVITCWLWIENLRHQLYYNTGYYQNLFI